MKEIISSLDIGSSTVKLIVGEYYDGEVNVLAVSEVKSRGVKRGLIASPEDALVSIKEAFSRCEEMLNIKIDKVILNVPSYYAEFVASEGSHKINNVLRIVACLFFQRRFGYDKVLRRIVRILINETPVG